MYVTYFVGDRRGKGAFASTILRVPLFSETRLLYETVRLRHLPREYVSRSERSVLEVAGDCSMVRAEKS